MTTRGMSGRHIVCKRTGFDFGTDNETERRLVAILGSEQYARPVQYWGSKNQRFGDSTPNSSFAVSSYDSYADFASSTAFVATPGEKSKRFSRFAAASCSRLRPRDRRPLPARRPTCNRASQTRPGPILRADGGHPLTIIHNLVRERVRARPYRALAPSLPSLQLEGARRPTIQVTLPGPAKELSVELSCELPSIVSSPTRNANAGPKGSRSTRASSTLSWT
ncbi:hypothetical protein K488DRAFT_89463 [Vararia minispora EC-137]|uniref:Uncharacterized protein n=1 Tax=Vararia minispora EC-137 TaxID=1314806 RepID=A0ACB8QAM5_9AGAM|nr:hypothetical protein K488DRAFT_89463 [Vararia minispora EC-137]